jgi:hypothetical protein
MRTHIVIDKDLVDSIDKLVGRRARSRFLAEAAEKELRRVRLAHSAREVADSLVGKDTPPEWDTAAGTVAWIEASRKADDDKLNDLLGEQ